jgi:hypothetical protein
MVRMNRAAVGGNNHRVGLPFCVHPHLAAMQMQASSADLQQSIAADSTRPRALRAVKTH